MNEVLDLKLSLRTWAFIGLAQGLCGAVVLGGLGAIWSATQGQWVDLLATPLLLPCTALASLVMAIAGFPIYSWLVKQRANAVQSLPWAAPNDGSA
jgi:hypothetical protein